MNPSIANFISAIGKSEDSQQVHNLIIEHELVDVYDDPPFRRYIGSRRRGLDFLFEEGVVIDFQIHVVQTKTRSAFVGELPFGLVAGMNREAVHKHLNAPLMTNEYSSHYAFPELGVKITACYSTNGNLRYISVADLGRWRALEQLNGA
jgi:hypothetical protein